MDMPGVPEQLEDLTSGRTFEQWENYGKSKELWEKQWEKQRTALWPGDYSSYNLTGQQKRYKIDSFQNANFLIS